jgi:hypothetical protein
MISRSGLCTGRLPHDFGPIELFRAVTFLSQTSLRNSGENMLRKSCFVSIAPTPIRPPLKRLKQPPERAVPECVASLLIDAAEEQVERKEFRSANQVLNRAAQSGPSAEEKRQIETLLEQIANDMRLASARLLAIVGASYLNDPRRRPDSVGWNLRERVLSVPRWASSTGKLQAGKPGVEDGDLRRDDRSARNGGLRLIVRAHTP